MASKKKGSKKTEAVNENIIRDERYRLLFEASQDAIMFLDRERFFDCNPATLKMFGLTKEEFIKRHPSEISPPRQSNGKTSREEADRRIAEAFTEGTNKFEWIHRRSSGEDFAATVWLTAFPLEGRDVLQATVREISPSDESLADLELHRLKLQMLLDEQTKGFVMEKDDRKRAEKEVKRLIKAVESSINAVAFFDMDLNFIYANNALCRLARIERDDLKNRNASDFIPPKSMKVIMENIRRLIDGQEIEVFEVKSLTAQGQELWIEIAGSVLFSDLGEPEGLLAIINDVTERKRIQKALEESEEKFKSLVERSLDGILIILDGKVAYMNPALIKLSGYSLKEQLGRDFIENVAPEARQDVMVKYKSRMAGGNVPQIYETILMAKDGTRIPIEVNAGVMEFLGEPADFVYLRDLTERRKAMDDFRIIKDRLEYVLGATKTGYDIIDPDYNVVYVDPAWTKTLGDYQGKKCYEYFKGMKKPCNICGIQEALKSKKTIVTEEYLMKENRYTEVHTIPFETENGDWLVAEFNLDITEKRKMLQKLQESEEKFRNLAEYSPNMIFINIGGRVVYANRMCGELMGYTTEEFIAPDFDLMNIIHEDYREFIRENLQKHFKGKEMPPYECKLVTKQGRVLDSIINTKIMDYGGKKAILGIVTDITDLKRVQYALNDRERTMTTLMGNLPGMAYRCLNDLNWTMKYVSDGCLALTGYTAAELRDNAQVSYAKAIHEEDRDMVWKEVQKAMKKKKSFQITYRIITKDGAVRWVWEKGTGIFSGKELVALEGFITDITKRTLAEQSIRENEEKYRKLMETANDAIFLADAKTGILIDVNQKATELVGRTKDELIGMKQAELHPKGMAKKYREIFKRHIKEGSAIEEDIYAQHKDGTNIPITISASTFELDGVPLIQGIFHDLRERKKIEDALLDSERTYRGLYESTIALADTTDIKEIIAVITDQATSMLNGEYSSIYLWDESEGLNIPFYTNAKIDADKFMSHKLKPGEGLTGTVAMKRKGGYVNFDQDVKKVKGYIPGTKTHRDHLQSVIAEPMLVEGQLLGVINVIAEERRFNEDDLSKMEILAHQATFAFLRSRNINELKKSAERFRQVAENVGEWIWEVDVDGLYTYASPSIKDILGYEPEDVVGKKHFYDFFSPEVREDLKKKALQFFKQKKAFKDFPNPNLHKDGHTVILETSGMPILDDRKILLGYRGANMDITERMNAEKALRENEEKYRKLMESANDAIFLADAKTGILIDANKKATELIGRDRFEIIGMHQTKLHPTEEVKRYMEIFKAHVKDGRAIEENIYALHKDGHKIPVSISSSIFEIQGVLVNQGIFHDLTERVKNEQRIVEIMTFNENIITNSPIGLITTDMAGNITKVNPAALNILGSKSAEETMKFNVLSFEPLVKQGIAKLFETCIKKGKEIKNHTISYTSFWDKSIIANINIVPLISQGKQSSVLAMIEDITEKKEIEKALQASEQVYKSLYESTMALGELKDITRLMKVIAEQARNMLDGECSTIYLWEEERKVLVPYYSNARHEKDKFMAYEMPLGTGLTGSAAKSMKGSYANYNDPKARKGYVPGTKSDTDYLQSIIAEPLLSEGKLLGVINVIAEEKIFNDEDLAKLRILAKQATVAYLHTQSLDELMNSEERFRRMAENIHDGLTIIEDGAVTYVNDRAVEIYGYPRDELMKKTHIELIIPEDREQMKAIIENARKKNQRLGELEFWVQGKDGSRKYIRTRISTTQEGESTSEFIITTDITARKQAEDENKRRTMKFLLEDGRMYLVKEFRPVMSIEAFNDLLNMEYFGLVLSRTPKKDLEKSIHGHFEYFWLGEKSDEKEPFEEVMSAIDKIGGKSVVLIERLDYLIFKYGFDRTMQFIFKLRDQIYLKEQVVIISIDTSTLQEEQLNMMQKEMSKIERRHIPKPDEELMEIAQMIYEKNSSGIKPSYSEIGEELKLSKPTFRKRVRRLISSGYAVEVTKGNRKVLELTQKGRSLFFE